MGLSTQDFATAFRALSSRACTLRDLRRALKAQAGRMGKGRRLTLAEALSEEGILPAARAAELGAPGALDPRSDPATLEALGGFLLQSETVAEPELDRILDLLTRRPDPRTLPGAPVPRSLRGYDVLWEVGRGRSGAVHRATRRDPPGPVAIKVFRKDAFDSDADRAALVERVRAMVGSADPGLVKVFEAGEAEGHAFVAMEFVQGPTLATLLADHKMSMRRGFEIVERAASALGPLHARNRAHGSLSGTSVLVGGDDRPRIAEFGWTPGGSPGEDVAALGALMYEIAAGQPPFGGFRASQLKPPSQVNPAAAGGAERIILKALARDPARRYPEAGALAADIGRHLRHEEVLPDVPAGEAPPPAASARARSRKWWIVGAAAAVVLGVGAWAVFRGGGDATQPPSAAPQASIPGPTPAPGPAPAPPKPRTPEPKTDARRAALAKKGPMKPSDEIDFRMQATGFLATREFDKLERLAEEALARGPERDWAHHYFAIAAKERGDSDAALLHADRAAEMGMDRPELIELRIDICLARAEYRRVLEDLRRLYPVVTAANAAIRRLTEEIAAEPRDAGLRIRRGALHHYRKLYSRAIADFEAAVSGGESKAHYFLALTLIEERRIDEAAEALRRFLAAHGALPGAAEARLVLETLPK
jgi:tetratricopeptide (TPR) repeat protein